MENKINFDEIVIDGNPEYDKEGNIVGYALIGSKEQYDSCTLTIREIMTLINKFGKLGSLSYYGAIIRLKEIANGRR